MQTGARLSNEGLDSRLPVAILQAGRAAAMYRGRNESEVLPDRKPGTYPMLPTGFVEGEFEIAGLEGDDEQKDIDNNDRSSSSRFRPGDGNPRRQQ